MLGVEYSPCYHCDKTKCSFCELTRHKDLQQKKEGREVKIFEKNKNKEINQKLSIYSVTLKCDYWVEDKETLETFTEQGGDVE